MSIGTTGLQGLEDGTTPDYAGFVPIYDRVNAVTSFGTGNRYRRWHLSGLEPVAGEAVLDIGCGTGRMYRRPATRRPDRSGGGPRPLPRDARGSARLGFGNQPRHDRGTAVPRGLLRRRDLRLRDPLRARPRGRLHEHAAGAGAGGRLLLLEMFWPRNTIGRLLVAGYVRGVAKVTNLLLGGSGASTEMLEHLWSAVDAGPGPREIVAALEANGFIDVHSGRTGLFLGEIKGRAPR